MLILAARMISRTYALAKEDTSDLGTSEDFHLLLKMTPHDSEVLGFGCLIDWRRRKRSHGGEGYGFRIEWIFIKVTWAGRLSFGQNSKKMYTNPDLSWFWYIKKRRRVGSYLSEKDVSTHAHVKDLNDFDSCFASHALTLSSFRYAFHER